MKNPNEIAAWVEKIEAALGEDITHVAVYHNPGEPLPWRIADDQYGEDFATPEEAIEAAEQWRDAILNDRAWMEEENRRHDEEMEAWHAHMEAENKATRYAR